MQKISEFKIRKQGSKGSGITMPTVYLNDNELQPTDRICVYRTTINGMDCLVYIPKKLVDKQNFKNN